MTFGQISPGSEKMYLFSYNYMDPKCSVDAVVEYVKAARNITSWAYYTPGCIVFKSSSTAYDLAESLRRIASNANCIVVEINPNNIGGWLPKNAWDWFTQNNPSYPPLATGVPTLLEALKK